MSSRIRAAASRPARRQASARQDDTAGDNGNTLLASVIEHLPITAVAAYERNPRDHDDRQIKKLAGIIRTVGFLVPIIIDHAGTIIAGHGRLAAAKELGLRTVPVIRAGHLSPHQVQAVRVADNRIGELSSWNRTALALELLRAG
jgi:ParB-like chromosome segregation protein Spo0J